MPNDREPVKSYVPSEQKEKWEEKAEEWDMTMSEFVRTMVQAGKLWFDEMDAELLDSIDHEEFTDEFRGGA